jgi:hypothetical protein
MQVVWCLVCGQSPMFALMAAAESPATLFELLYTRLPANATARIMYDNACNAEQYFLNREPKFARNLEFYVDNFHFQGHTHCCKAYDTGTAPHRYLVNIEHLPGYACT